MSLIEYVVGSVCSVQFCVLGVITCILYYNVRYMKYKLPPRPQAWPIIGNMFAADQSTFHNWCMEQAKTHGPIIRYTVGFLQDAIIINDMKHAHESMVDRGKDFAGRPLGVLFDEGSEGYMDVAFGHPSHPNWALRRKLLATSVRNFTNGRAFEQRTMLTFGRLMPILDAKADSGEAFNPKMICKLYLTNHISGICFSKTYQLDSEEFKLVMKDFEDFNQLLGEVQISDMFPFLNYLPITMPDRKKARETGMFMFNLFSDEIQKRKDAFKGGEPQNLTDYLLKVMSEDDAYSVLTEVEIRQIIADVFTAGIDTSQTQLRWMLVVLASHPEVQERIYQDILEIIGPIGKDDPEFGVSSIDYRSSLPYLDAFILESTRFGTVAPVGLPRRAVCDTQVGGYDVVEGMQVIVNQYAINYSEKEHEKPDEFRPERFLTEEGQLGPRPGSYMPFGLGRRSCPGETASRNSLWMTLVMLLRRYQILPPEGRKIVRECGKHVTTSGEPEDFEIRLKYRD